MFGWLKARRDDDSEDVIVPTLGSVPPPPPRPDLEVELRALTRTPPRRIPYFHEGERFEMEIFEGSIDERTVVVEITDAVGSVTLSASMRRCEALDDVEVGYCNFDDPDAPDAFDKLDRFEAPDQLLDVASDIPGRAEAVVETELPALVRGVIDGVSLDAHTLRVTADRIIVQLDSSEIDRTPALAPILGLMFELAKTIESSSSLV